MNQRFSIPASESVASSGIRRHGWLFVGFYWIAQGVYSLFATTICCFVFSVAFFVASPALTPLAAHLTFAGIGVISVLIGVQAAYRNHRWIQRRELAKRNT